MAAFDCKKCGQPHPRGCTGHKPNGSPCGNAPIKAGTVCRYHGGAAGQVRRKADERVEKAEIVAAAHRLGVRVEIDPGEALLAALYAAYGELRYLEARVAAREDEVYGELYHASTHKGAERQPTGEAKRHILVQMLEDATERVAKIAALALRAGVEERRLRLAEADARELAGVLLGALADVDAPAELIGRIKVAMAARLRARALPAGEAA